MRALRSVGAFLWAMRWSVGGFVLMPVLTILSFGYVSLALYYPVSPVLDRVFPPLAAWHGPWVWPVLLMVGMAFAPAFLIAGAVDVPLARAGHRNAVRHAAYLPILWLGALLAWALVLSVAMPPGGRG